MVALRRMARSQEKINESQELTTQDDTLHSASSGTEKRGRKRRKNGIATRGNGKVEAGGFESRKETLNFAISTEARVRNGTIRVSRRDIDQRVGNLHRRVRELPLIVILADKLRWFSFDKVISNKS